MAFVLRDGPLVAKNRPAVSASRARVETGDTPHLFDVEPPHPWVDAVRVVDCDQQRAA
jgi:hypothetical protein